MEQFLELRTVELLKEFGAGSHAPGSGSATALIGLVAANLTYTVGKLTLNREGYENHRAEVDAICTRIHTILIPNLSSLFQEDAVVFDAVIQARRARNKAAQADWDRMNEECLKVQKLATAIPFKIAEVIPPPNERV
jgi:formiminotetrahydrofolate cyclodeaminase